MKKFKKIIPDLKGREFNGKMQPKIKRVKPEPRQKIRQLLRSFIPMNRVDGIDENFSDQP